MDAPDDGAPTAHAIAEALVTGKPGAAMADDLMRLFPTASRWSTFLGVATAMAIVHADLLLAESENAWLKEELKRAQGGGG